MDRSQIDPFRLVDAAAHASISSPSMNRSLASAPKTTRNLYGDERTPERKAADKARLLEKLEQYKVKVAKR